MSDQARLRSLCRGSRVNQHCILVRRPPWSLGGSPAIHNPPARCGAASTILCGGRRPLLRGQARLVESGIKVTVIVFMKETSLQESDTLRECFKNMDVWAPLWQSEPQNKSSCREFASSHPSSLNFRISYYNLCAFTFVV